MTPSADRPPVGPPPDEPDDPSPLAAPTWLVAMTAAGLAMLAARMAYAAVRLIRHATGS